MQPVATPDLPLDDLASLHARVLKTLPSLEESRALAWFFVAQGGQLALARGDADGVLRAAKEARAQIRFDLETDELRARAANRPPPHIAEPLAMLAAIITDSPDHRAAALRDAGMPADTLDGL